VSANALFTYGTLMVPEIWRAVTGLPEKAKPISVILNGYQRRKVAGADFPAIIASENVDDIVHGLVFENITAEVFNRLDRYEDKFYRRVEVTVEPCNTSTPPLSCQTYVVPESARHMLSSESWDLDWFKKHALDRYLAALGVNTL
jgi:gamma-glutamylcyclotransferase (GGCT)/AIG2-like uncharacterized protein YtfP